MASSTKGLLRPSAQALTAGGVEPPDSKPKHRSLRHNTVARGGAPPRARSVSRCKALYSIVRLLRWQYCFLAILYS